MTEECEIESCIQVVNMCRTHDKYHLECETIQKVLTKVNSIIQKLKDKYWADKINGSKYMFILCVFEEEFNKEIKEMK